MPNFDGSSDNRNAATRMLERLAASLGCSVEVFSGQGTHELSQTLELLRLWLAVDDGQDRAKALAFLRNMRAQTGTAGRTEVPVGSEPLALEHTAQKPELDV